MAGAPHALRQPLLTRPWGSWCPLEPAGTRGARGGRRKLGSASRGGWRCPWRRRCRGRALAVARGRVKRWRRRARPEPGLEPATPPQRAPREDGPVTAPLRHTSFPRPAAPPPRDRRCGGVSWPRASRDPLAVVRAARGCGCRRGMEQWRVNDGGSRGGARARAAERSGGREEGGPGPWRDAPRAASGALRPPPAAGRAGPGVKGSVGRARRYRGGPPAAASLRGSGGGLGGRCGDFV